MELKKGTTLQNGKYSIVQKIGSGAFGITYLASMRVQVAGALGAINSTIPVAIKEFFMAELSLRKDDNRTIENAQSTLTSNYRRKFRNEATNLSHMEHPNIVKVLEVWDENNTTYYAMEFLDGGCLDDQLKQNGALAEEAAKEKMSQIGSAVDYMHSKRMLHLDLKPKNVMMRKDGSPVLIDFGLSKQYDANGEPESSTSVGGGTPGYSPTEQADYHGGNGFPATMDVYALGATLYKMLTARTPPVASSILNDGIPNEHLEACGVSAATIAVVKKAMSPSHRNRYQTVREFLAALSGAGAPSDDDITIVRTSGNASAAASSSQPDRSHGPNKASDTLTAAQDEDQTIVPQKKKTAGTSPAPATANVPTQGWQTTSSQTSNTSSHKAAAPDKPQTANAGASGSSQTNREEKPQGKKKTLAIALGIAAAIAVIGVVIFLAMPGKNPHYQEALSHVEQYNKAVSDCNRLIQSGSNEDPTPLLEARGLLDSVIRPMDSAYADVMLDVYKRSLDIEASLLPKLESVAKAWADDAMKRIENIETDEDLSLIIQELEYSLSLCENAYVRETLRTLEEKRDKDGGDANQ